MKMPLRLRTTTSKMKTTPRMKTTQRMKMTPRQPNNEDVTKRDYTIRLMKTTFQMLVFCGLSYLSEDYHVHLWYMSLCAISTKNECV